jgi:hypothetical protein
MKVSAGSARHQVGNSATVKKSPLDRKNCQYETNPSNRSSSGSSEGSKYEIFKNRVRDNRSDNLEPSATSRMDFLSNSSIAPSTEKEILPTFPAKRTNGFDFSFGIDVSFLNLLKTKMAFSKDESNFALLAEAVGIKIAIFLASKSRWKLRKPLPELFSNWSALGRNCTKRQTKKQRLSSEAKTCCARSLAG